MGHLPRHTAPAELSRPKSTLAVQRGMGSRLNMAMTMLVSATAASTFARPKNGPARRAAQANTTAVSRLAAARPAPRSAAQPRAEAQPVRRHGHGFAPADPMPMTIVTAIITVPINWCTTGQRHAPHVARRRVAQRSLPRHGRTVHRDGHQKPGGGRQQADDAGRKMPYNKELPTTIQNVLSR